MLQGLHKLHLREGEPDGRFYWVERKAKLPEFSAGKGRGGRDRALKIERTVDLMRPKEVGMHPSFPRRIFCKNFFCNNLMAMGKVYKIFSL